MKSSSVLLLCTLNTKLEEAEYLRTQLIEHKIDVRILDVSLISDSKVLSGVQKINAMAFTSNKAILEVENAIENGVSAIVGLGGGTGGEIILQIMRALPITFPKILVTTLPFDPRTAMSDTSIILVPTLADICGLNTTLREVLNNAAAITAGLCMKKNVENTFSSGSSIGITALGATESAIVPLVAALRQKNKETTVFHANGYGGAAFARFAERNAFHTIIDLTPHELTRLHIAGAHAPMPTRFSVSMDLQRIVLPGGLNFIGLGEKLLIPEKYLKRDHYEHSGFFTHVKVSETEMIIVAKALCDSLNLTKGPTKLIVQMGGFSHQDISGGAIEDENLRNIFLQTVNQNLKSHIKLVTHNVHISDPEITVSILNTLEEYSSTNKEY